MMDKNDLYLKHDRNIFYKYVTYLISMQHIKERDQMIKITSKRSGTVQDKFKTGSNTVQYRFKMDPRPILDGPVSVP